MAGTGLFVVQSRIPLGACSAISMRLHSNTVLRLKGEVDGQGWDTRAGAADSHSSASAASAPPLTSATVQLRHKMRGAEARAELGVNRRVLLMGGPSGAASGFASLPVDLTLDVATPSGSASALQYRMGLHHVRMRQSRVCACSTRVVHSNTWLGADVYVRLRAD